MGTGGTGVLQALGAALVIALVLLAPGTALVRRSRRTKLPAWQVAAGWILTVAGVAGTITCSVLVVYALWPKLFNDQTTYESPGWRPPKDA